MNLVAIVGRPNTGKSTLFNRICGGRTAIVEDTPGVTRDRIYGEWDWNGKQFMLIDTGGFIPGSESTMEKAIREQAVIAIEDADAVIFLCDGREGITSYDEDIAEILRTSSKPVTLVVNKCDNVASDMNVLEFHKLGLGTPYSISALSGRSTGDFLDEVVANLSSIDFDSDDSRLKIAFVGRPNVGKSSLTNALLGSDRSIVTDIPGTTRDSIDSVLKYYGREIVLIDTAGLRKKSHVKENIELYSILRTSRAIERCDVAVVIIDATRGLEDQDKRIMTQVEEEKKGIILAINKWDLVEKDNKTADIYMKNTMNLIPRFDYVPAVFISALTKQRISKIIAFATEIHSRRGNRISTSSLNHTLLPEFERTSPPAVKGHDLRINYITQIGTEPPKFAFFLNHPQLLPDSYKIFMERIMRQHFDLEGTPVSFIFKRKNVKWEDRE